MTGKPNNEQPEEPSANGSSVDESDLSADLAHKYVYVRDVGPEGNVRFDFAIGWPELCVELVLPKAAFDEFCRHNQVCEMSSPDAGLQSMSGGDEE
jgi:phenol hydroxylase P0 protein